VSRTKDSATTQAQDVGCDLPNAHTSTSPGWSGESLSIESAIIDGRRRIVYTGPSMNPTLREPDLLWVEPYGNRPIRAGDVVCFESPEHDTNIVHRVISISRRRMGDGGLRDEIRTRGDNNQMLDTAVLAADNLLGRVVAAQRGSRLRSIPGGRTGLLVAWVLRRWKSIWRVVAGLVSRVYQLLVRGGPLGFLLPGSLRPRLVCFNGRDGAIFKLLMRGRTVGDYDYRFMEWHIRRPFRLFIDTRSLPIPKARD